MKRYNIVNNVLGWFCFLVAAVTYLLTIEPTASFWDCPEFITQGFKLEVGHPPGNPIFMLTARFFVTLFGGGPEMAAVAVNSMSALLSAGTILLLFWTVTHLAKRLVVKDGSEISARQMVLIMGAGVAGALAYTWSDTFWFSAVEGEVYAFSSFCTALVFWLILKWESRADNPGSDRYLVLIAYIIGVSIAVHLLNLLCIPAIVLVIYYRKFKKTNVVGSLAALGVSVALIVLILYGLVPGFISVAQRFEVLCVNQFGMSYNVGVLIYAIVTVAAFIWTIYELRRQDSVVRIKIGMLVSIILSGMPFIGHGWLVPTLLVIALVVYLWMFCKQVPVRVFNVIIMSIFVIFIGYSSYALLLIRSTANTPMNQNAPDNVFDLGSYLNREQYGDSPLLYGPMFAETFYRVKTVNEDGNPDEIVPVDIDGKPLMGSIVPVEYDGDGAIDLNNGSKKYVKIAKTDPSQPDRYVREQPDPDYKVPDGMSMLFTRMYSERSDHVHNYKSWAMYDEPEILRAPAEKRAEWASRGPVFDIGEAGYAYMSELAPYLDYTDAKDIVGRVNLNQTMMLESPMAWSPSFGDNLSYFVGYQLNHMYWRYFMWNFAGRQNDIQGNGEPHCGNWLSGIPAIDNARLGDQSLLPAEYGEENAGHNVFYMMPLILGIIGLLWQSTMRHAGGTKRGIEQFWVIFFLFFMTGIAIVLYLNQTPGQPRERDYAFAGSFYAFAIWIGLGVPGLAAMLRALIGFVTGFKTKKDKKDKSKETDKAELSNGAKWATAVIAAVVGLIVPLQMVSQTWDDHDRSNRYTARDFGMNYLNSLAPNAIIFVNGDNDTFPLWYAQEVEGVRTDVKVVNLSYLSQDWYARQVASDTYDADGVRYMMPDQAFAYNRFSMSVAPSDYLNLTTPLVDKPVCKALTESYDVGPLGTISDPKDPERPFKFNDSYVFPTKGTGLVYAPLDSTALMSVFGRIPEECYDPQRGLIWDMSPNRYLGGGGGLSRILPYDIIATSATNGFHRPVYFASTVGGDHTNAYAYNMYSTGMANMVTPFDRRYDASPVAEFGYCNIVGKFRFGGLDSGKKIYLDETVRRMVTSTRLAIMEVVSDLLETPDTPAGAKAVAVSREKGLPAPETYADMAANLMSYMTAKMPASVSPYEGIECEVAGKWVDVAVATGNQAYLKNAREILAKYIERNASMLAYANSIRDNSAMYTNLMRAERRTIRRIAYAFGVMAYADYAEIQMNLADDDERRVDIDTQLGQIGAILTSLENFSLLRSLFVDEITMAELEDAWDKIAENDDYSQQVIARTARIVSILDELGIDRSSAAKAYFKKAGVSAKVWNNIADGR